jgi:hypothetical protein
MTNDTQEAHEKQKTGEARGETTSRRSKLPTFDDLKPGKALASNGTVVHMETAARHNRAVAALQNFGKRR